MDTPVIRRVAAAIQAEDAGPGTLFGIDDAAAERFARAAVAAYGAALAEAGLAIVPLAVAEAMQAHDQQVTEQGRKAAEDRESVKKPLERYRRLTGRKA
ncbi:hypothetical protein OPKNFCMD_2154 [Methylobacterium crusticola]|uniref:Uncharacterized protein n=1 Tax=Methylobacterium crusticola TaxID=1697972 RepID=A0ABQ4QW26_9HYPH|nr:hypothetical protein [Methylobacterium crusticola]GJD49424.1 hypothetical protein OPKNFCMD_2154 [Methylobacterium crusticola]